MMGLFLLIVLFYIASGEEPTRRLDGVMVTNADISDFVFPLSVKSALKFLVGLDTIYVISPPQSYSDLKHAYGKRFGKRVHWVKEGTFNITKTDVENIMFRTAKKKRKGVPRYHIDGQSLLEKTIKYQKGGWYLQQILKFQAGDVLDLQDYIVLDSDIIWYRPITLRSPQSSKTPEVYKHVPTYNYAFSTQYHIQYYATMKVLTGLWPDSSRKTHFSGIVHHMIFIKEVLDDLKRTVYERHGLPLWKAMLNVSTLELISHYPWQKSLLSGAGSVLSEYEIYFHYAKQLWPFTQKLRPLMFANGPSPNKLYWPTDAITDGSIPADSWRRSPHWQKATGNQAKTHTFPAQMKADQYSGYDFVAYHKYADRRYYELRNGDVDNGRACKHLPMHHTPQEYYPGTTCSWKGFDEEKHNETLWFRDCLCYMFRFRSA
jgi:hypothetical protein